MNLDLQTALTVFVLSVLVGFEVISKVPTTLHTPLMSGANSIHGVVVIGAMLIASTAHDVLGYVLAFVAVAFGAMNVVGGYVVTDRMLHMFRARGDGSRQRSTDTKTTSEAKG
ncbi:NAD(P) transhydrogenase subunit alpha [Streptomyces sp. RB6PN25]|uniref:proton-translocating NAD(P)(+) transhydrogenase n=1 Tax=Streptomyces humicola TaxID=2953240 RepID=A0ABT1Q502_9ACTN|nr:NAD(P) transhydrogenase subunit alpha [Streptomyces humicola]MCQ4084991.1 NAD(P) transhydrogenase subunit alpha [Streptomyces humicola]